MKRIILLFTLLFSLGIYSQVTVTIESLQYTNYGSPAVNVSSCGTINLASSNDTSITFGVKLTKPYNQVVGNARIVVYTQKNSVSEKKEKQSISISPSSWTSGDASNPSIRATSTTVNVNVNEFDTSGGTFFVEYIDGLAKKSCTYAVIRDMIPEFRLSPASVSIACNSKNPVTFTETNVYNSPGTVTYSWTIGAGWNYAAGTYQTSGNTLTLTPVSYPPSNISVTAKLGAINYSGGSSIMSLAPFTSTATITGISSYCTYPTLSTFSIDAGAGSTVAWSTSSSSIGSISSPTNTQVNVTSQTQGIFTLSAVITNSCGQTVTKTKVVTVGAPMPIIDNYYCPTESAPCSLNNVANNNYLMYNLSAPLGSYTPVNADWEWEKISGNFYFLNNGQYTGVTATGQQANIYLTGANPTDNAAKFKVRVKNSCGWGNWRTYHWNDGTTTTPTNPGTNPPSAYFKVAPNPVSNFFTISLINPSTAPQTSSPKAIKIYSQYGQLLQNNIVFYGVGYNDFNMSTYASGTYYVSISFDNFSESHTIIKL